jgi:hypothetical protein
VLDRVRGRARVERPWDDRHASAYQILGVEPDASSQAIRRAYLDLVRMWHPDRFADEPVRRDEAEVATKRINEAYEVLSRRAQERARTARRSQWDRMYASSRPDHPPDPYQTSAWDVGGPARTATVVAMTLLICLMMSVVVCYVTYTLEHATSSYGMLSRY